MLYDFLTGCPDKDFQKDYTLVNAQCHSLSEPRSSGYSQRIPGYTVTKNSKWFPQIHLPCVPLQPPLDGRWSLKWLQGNENVQYNSAAYCSESNSDIHNQSLVSQRKTLSNKDLTTYVAVNNQRRQNGSGIMTLTHVCTKCSPPAKCHRPNCPSYLCTQEIEQINPSCCKKRPEKRDIPKSSLLVHIPSAFQKTHVVQDGQNDVGSKQLANSQRASLKIRDYYEERGSLVEKIYTNVPTSREKTQAKHSRLSYARKIADGFDENHHRQHLSKAVVFQDPILENVPFRARVRQQDFVAGSEKRKNRQPPPQGVREDDPTLAGNEKKPAHYEDNQCEKICQKRIHQQANLLSPSITIKGSPELRDPNFRVTTSPCEDASNTRVPAHLVILDGGESMTTASSKTHLRRHRFAEMLFFQIHSHCVIPHLKVGKLSRELRQLLILKKFRVELGHRLESFSASTPFQTNFHSSMKGVHFTSSKHQA